MTTAIDIAIAALAMAVADAVEARAGFEQAGLDDHVFDQTPTVAAADSLPRRQGPWLIHAVTVSYPTEDEDMVRAWGRLVRDALRPNPTLGGTCVRTTIDDDDARAVTVRIVIRVS